MANIEHTTEYKQFLQTTLKNTEYAKYLLVLSTNKLINEEQLLEKMNDELMQFRSELMILHTQLEKLGLQGEQIISQEMQIQEMQIKVAQAETQLKNLEEYSEQLLTQSKPVLEIDAVRWWYEVLICRYIDAFEYYVSQVLLRVFIGCPDLLKGSDNRIRGMSES